MGCFVPTNNIDTSDATATVSTILNGYTAYVASGKITGSYVAPVQTTTELYVLMSSYQGNTAWYTEWAKFINGTCYGNVAPSGITITEQQIQSGRVMFRNSGSYTWTIRQMGNNYNMTLTPSNYTGYLWASGLTVWRTY